jgi:hypothetical protein
MRWRPRDRLKFVVFTLAAIVVIACGVAAALVLAGAGDGPGSRGARLTIPRGVEALAGGGRGRVAQLARAGGALPSERQIAQVFMDQEQAFAAVLAATRTGRLPRARLQEALLRVLALKRRYGLLR